MLSRFNREGKAIRAKQRKMMLELEKSMSELQQRVTTDKDGVDMDKELTDLHKKLREIKMLGDQTPKRMHSAPHQKYCVIGESPQNVLLIESPRPSTATQSLNNNTTNKAIDNKTRAKSRWKRRKRPATTNDSTIEQPPSEHEMLKCAISRRVSTFMLLALSYKKEYPNNYYRHMSAPGRLSEAFAPFKLEEMKNMNAMLEEVAQTIREKIEMS